MHSIFSVKSSSILAADDHSPSAYKYRFKTWGWKKSLPTKKKEEILDIAQTRAVLGKRSRAIFCGSDVDSRKLKRHVNTIARNGTFLTQSSERSMDQLALILGPYLPFGPRM
jgi:hypothetical protein